MKPIRIKKSQLSKLTYNEEDVLTAPKKRRNRFQSLKVAAIRKSNKDTAVGITFRAAERGLFKIIAKVLIADKDYIVIEGGHVIPTRSIKHIE